MKDLKIPKGTKRKKDISITEHHVGINTLEWLIEITYFNHDHQYVPNVLALFGHSTQPIRAYAAIDVISPWM